MPDVAFAAGQEVIADSDEDDVISLERRRPRVTYSTASAMAVPMARTASGATKRGYLNFVISPSPLKGQTLFRPHFEELGDSKGQRE